MAESFFDIVSRVDKQEVDNALNQAAKEISNRFDFRGVGAAISWSGESVEIRANSEDRAKAVLDVFKDKLVRRGVSLKALDPGDPKPSGKEFRLTVGLKQGISQDDARKITKLIRDEGPKGVRAQVQGDELRVSSKKKDDLQAVIALVKGNEFGLAPLLLPDGFAGHPLRKDFPLAARAAQDWPGAREPGERATSARSRRRLVPPGVPEGWPPA